MSEHMADARAKRAAEIQDAIRQVLFRDWDPIGVGDNPNLEDEYDAYITPVYRILIGSRSEQELLGLLREIEGGMCGVSDDAPEPLRLIARRLLELDVKLDREENEMTDAIVEKYGKRVGYTESEVEKFHEGGHRIRQVKRLSQVTSRYSIEATVVQAKHCNSGHCLGQKFILDLDGNFISKLCPKRMCVYLLSQLTIPVALINERLSEALEPNDFHFMRYVRCPDTGVQCLGYGEVMLKVSVIPRGIGAGSDHA